MNANSNIETLKAPSAATLDNALHPYDFDYLEALEQLHRADNRLARCAKKLATLDRARKALARIKAAQTARAEAERSARGQGWFELRSVLNGGV